MMQSPKPRARVPERGYTLILSLFVMMSLFGIGIVVLSSTTGDLKEVGAIRSHASANAIAEAGIAWGIDYMSRTWDFEAAGNFNGPLSTFQPMNAHGSDKICGSSYASNPEACFPESIAEWLRIEPQSGGSLDPALVAPEESEFSTEKVSMPFGGGSYRVAIRDDDDGDGDYTVDSNGIILIRSYAVTAGGTRTMLEVAVGEGCRQ